MRPQIPWPTIQGRNIPLSFFPTKIKKTQLQQAREAHRRAQHTKEPNPWLPPRHSQRKRKRKKRRSSTKYRLKSGHSSTGGAKKQGRGLKQAFNEAQHTRFLSENKRLWVAARRGGHKPIPRKGFPKRTRKNCCRLTAGMCVGPPKRRKKKLEGSQIVHQEKRITSSPKKPCSTNSTYYKTTS